MKLEPVYLVAPRPKPPSMPTRRAFLFMGFAFAGGSVVGGACGYSIGAAIAKSGDLSPTGNAELDELRRLAVKAPLAELVENRLYFMMVFDRKYSSDEVLWRGVERLANAIAADPAFPDRRRMAKVMTLTIERLAPPLQFPSRTILERMEPLAK